MSQITTRGRRSGLRTAAAGFGAAALLAIVANPAQTQVVDVVVEPPSLKGVKPLLGDTSSFIADLTAAQQLGKALFWDVQVGSDGQACASCHFHAGADIRIQNQVNPGILAGDLVFDKKATGGVSGPNKSFSSADFPFHKLANVNNRESTVLFDTNDVFSSSGTFAGNFVSSKTPTKTPTATSPLLASVLTALSINLNQTTRFDSEVCQLTYDPFSKTTGTGSPFHANGLIYRKVEPRQTPTSVNAVYNIRQFWDGRANNEFNGVNPFGPRAYVPEFTVDGVKYGNPNAAGTGVLQVAAGSSAGVKLIQPLIKNASLASQAVGPPLSDFEMSCSNKTFADLGRKLIPLKPLAQQNVHDLDSVFSKTPGLVPARPNPGLTQSYEALIKRAFKPEFWNAKGKFVVDGPTGKITASTNGHTQMEHNFSLFWGLAVQAYEAMLISDDAPYDRGKAALSASAKRGLSVFMGKGKCIACHSGPLFSNATNTSISSDPNEAIETMVMGDGNKATYDRGFYNIGVRPTKEDHGVGGFDPYNFDLSFTRQWKWQLLGQGKRSPDHFDPNPCLGSAALSGDCTIPTSASSPETAPRDAVDGSFKTPILRNVGLNPPYFHNGGQATLYDVVRFYNRGGDRRGPLSADTTGLDTKTPFGVVNKTNLDADIGDASNTSGNNALGMTDAEVGDLVNFLLSLSDNRVACHSDVFDHPALPISTGHLEWSTLTSKRAVDIWKWLPAVGKKGLSTCLPNNGDLFGQQATFNYILR